MSITRLTDNDVSNVRSCAKRIRIKHDNKITKTKAKDLAAQEMFGFSTYNLFYRAYKAHNEQRASPERPDLINQANLILKEILDSSHVGDFWPRNPGENEGKLPVEELKIMLQNLFDHGISNGKALAPSLHHPVAWGISKKEIIDAGMEAMIKESTLDPWINGYIHFAIGYFFKSIFTCIQDEREEHPPFNAYMADFIDSKINMDKEPFEYLHEYYPSNAIVRIVLDGSIWGTANGVEYEGRENTHPLYLAN